ncbi:MAG: NAD(P)(+) transhydrogenase (Re/Si-specific) subunit beta [Ruminococcaceae bacterium]|nr:NAD(P)(+) transhydrogenase (Re/Si-specific) subunit beta [Oscillospiraceae bacterium]
MASTILSSTQFYIISGVLVLGVLIGLILMSKPEKARFGNALSAACTLVAIAVTMYNYKILPSTIIWVSIAIGAVVSLAAAAKVKMIQMPQVVALLNGLGGLASALVAILSYFQAEDKFSLYTAEVALVIGFVTFTGSLVAAGKLHKLLPQKPVVIPGHTVIIIVLMLATLVCVVLNAPIWITAILASAFGIIFAVRVGGADMPITISLLNSLSGVAGGIAGIAVGNVLLVAIGGIVGASGLLLTRIMCKAMNRKLLSILLGSTSVKAPVSEEKEEAEEAEEAAPAQEEVKAALTPDEILKDAKKIIIIPGYGMALAQAQSKVKALADKLEEKGAEVKFAIHPVAGRMPGHMNVLLCEVDVPYDKLYEMDVINPEFAGCDAVIVVGANDVINPAANTAEGTPIYGMPVLNAADAKYVIICNFDENPGYAGVPNPLYKNSNTLMLLGDANETVQSIIDCI